MSGRLLASLIPLFALICTVASAEPVKPAIDDQLAFSAPGSVAITGWVGHKLDLCLEHRVMAQDIDKLIAPFRTRQESDFGGFRCEYWGKWLTSAVLGCAYQPTPAHRAKIDEAVRALLATQTPDGYIGTYQPKVQLGGWDVWGRKYVLLGLIAYYDLTGDENVLQAAGRAADYLASQVGPGKTNIAAVGYPGWKGLPPSSILEPVAMLYQRTGNKRYLDLAKGIVAQWSIPNELAPQGLRLVEDALTGKHVAAMAAPKAYEMMSCYEGLCCLYRATGEKQYLDAALNIARDIRDTERMIVGSGSNHELWYAGTKCQTEVLEQPIETCVTATWVKLCSQLLRLTGDSSWADEMECSLYNALVASMTPQGEWWAYYCPLIGERVPSHFQHPDVGLSCCAASGPRGLLLTPRWAIMSAKDGPVVNLYAPSRASIKLPDGSDAKLTQETDYPVGDRVKLTVQPAAPATFTLALRIPAWSKRTTLTVNGQPLPCPAGRYAKIRREWQPGDRVDLKLDLRGRAIPAPSGAPELAVMRGPIVLALDNRLVAPRDVAVRLLTDPDGYVDLNPAAGKPDDVWMAFEVPFEIHEIHVKRLPTTLTMCDFASAGNRWSSDDLLRVWLPQPLFLAHGFTPDTWKLMYPGEKTRPTIPTRP